VGWRPMIVRDRSVDMKLEFLWKGFFSEGQSRKSKSPSGGRWLLTRQRERRSSRGRHCVEVARAVAMATVDANQPGSLCAFLHSRSPDASGTDTMPRAHVVIIRFPLSTTTHRTTSRARGCRRQRPTACKEPSYRVL
jgi:hypothetical protein